MFLFSPEFFFFFSIFYNIVVICNSRNWSNDTTESQKEKKACFNAHAKRKCNLTGQCIVSKQIKMWSLKSLVMLKCENRTSLYSVQYKWRPGFVLMFFFVTLEIASLDTLFLCSAGQQAWLCSLLILNFLPKLRLLFLYQKSVEYFEKIIKSPHFLHLTSVNWLILKMRLCFDTWCRVLCT